MPLFLLLAFLALALSPSTIEAQVAGSSTPRPARQENVLIVLADDLGVDFVGAYGEGSDPAPTPNIDGLARAGVLFRNAWACPSCSPTRACIQTGRYPNRTMVGRWIDYPYNSDTSGTLDPAEVTLPEVLDLDGGEYAHGMIGKWHLSYQYQGLRAPNDAGWSYFAGALVGRVDDYFSWERVENGVADPCSRYVTSQQVDDALAWIREQEKPWLCFLSLVAPHEPLHAPPAELHSQDLSGVPTLQRTYYKAAIEAMDSELGRLFETLGPEVMGRTNVIFLGDNGSIQGMAAPPFLRKRAKGTPYEGGLNVPLIIAGPAVVDPGREVAELACAVDVFHTALDLAGALDALPPWVQTDGVSLLPCLVETAGAPLREFAFSEQFVGNSWPAPLDVGFAVIRNARYKWIQRVDHPDELYDLVADPWESQNLLAAPLTPVAERNLVELRDGMAAIRANRASVVAFGASTCSGSNGLVPRIQCHGRPRIGSRYDIGVTDCLGQSPVLHLFGFDAMEWHGLPLPLSLSAIDAGSGCAMYIAPESLSVKWTDASGAAVQSILVPNAPSLVGTRVFHQWLALDPYAPGNSLGWVTSDALAAGLGL